jgi:hypothetical protein
MGRKIKISTIVTTSIVVTVGLTLGVIVGVHVGNALSVTGAVDYSAYTIEKYEDDYAALMKKYDKDKSVSSYQPYELVNIAIEKFAKNEHSKTVTRGNVKAAIVTQEIFGEDVRDGNEFYTESLSYSSIKKCGVRFYQHADSIDEYRGTNIKSNGSATFQEKNKSTVSFKEHEDNWGKTLSRPVIYIISSKTVLDSTLEETADGYKVTMNLDKVTSVLRYVKQMVSISNLDRTPDFSKVSLSFNLDKDLNLKQMSTEEEYVVYVVGKNESKGKLTVDFYQDVTDKIPGLDDQYPY